MTAAPRRRPGAAGRSHDLSVTRQRLWESVDSRDEHAATAAVLGALDDGIDAESILIDVIAPVQQRLGEEWAANRISVAQEHAATAINDRVIAALSRHQGSRGPERRGTVLVACVEGEWHVMPARLLAEVLTLRGWEVDFLGAHVPTLHLITHIHDTGPDVVALSASTPTRLPAAHAVISACRATGTPVLAGGAAFGPDGRCALLLGADGWAPDAGAAADRLAAGLVPRPADPEAMRHLADGEHRRVSHSAAFLVQQTMAGLEQRLPAMRTYTEQQRHQTAEDVAHIVDSLVAALYVDDDELFTTFIAWTADVLACRAVPGESLRLALDLVAGQVQSLPRATRMIGRAREDLDARLLSSARP